MRKLLLGAAIVLASIGSLTPLSGSAAELSMTRVALNNSYQAPVGERLKRLANPDNAIRTAFCGQCTKDADCGVGFRCVGRPECMECKKSP